MSHDLGNLIDEEIKALRAGRQAKARKKAEIEARWTNERISRMVEEIKTTLKEKSIDLNVSYLNASNGKSIVLGSKDTTWLTYRIELTNSDLCDKTLGMAWNEIARTIAHIVFEKTPDLTGIFSSNV